MAGLSASEVRGIVQDRLNELKAVKGTYSVEPRRVTMLVGGRAESILIMRGITFYGMRGILEKIDRLYEEGRAAKASRAQIDLEDLIKTKKMERA